MLHSHAIFRGVRREGLCISTVDRGNEGFSYEIRHDGGSVMLPDLGRCPGLNYFALSALSALWVGPFV